MLQLRETERLIVVGDRVLIKPRSAEAQTKSGLLLPPGVEEQDEARSGYIIKTGPGYVVPSVADAEPWQERDEAIKYVPLQAQTGDLAVYLRKYAVEVQFNDTKYVIVPHNAILLLYRDEGFFEN